MSPRVTSLEDVSTYALRGIRVRGVENPQGFGIDKRRFIESDLSIMSGRDFCIISFRAKVMEHGLRGYARIKLSVEIRLIRVIRVPSTPHRCMDAPLRNLTVLDSQTTRMPIRGHTSRVAPLDDARPRMPVRWHTCARNRLA